MPKNWKRDHDPGTPPVGCNGKPGDSGRKKHRRAGTEQCAKCREAAAWAARERRRGQGLPRPLHPCGTPAAAKRHRDNGERLCVPCAIAEARYHAENRAKHRATLAALHTEAAELSRRILARRRRQCQMSKQHTPDHCKACGVHAPAGRLQLPAPDERIAA